MSTLRKIFRRQSGQGLIELGLALPFVLVLTLGAVEISNMLNDYLSLTHVTREGANLTSRDTDPKEALDAIIESAKPTLCEDGDGCATNTERWTVIYSEIAPVDAAACAASPVPSNSSCDYVVVDQMTRGSFDPSGAGIQCGATGSQIGCAGDSAKPDNLYNNIGAGRTLFAVEVFYQYETITPLKSFGVTLPGMFYDKAVF